MEFLLDPNVAYLFLMGGVLLGMLALATPGTGLIEIGALFCMAVAAYGIVNLTINPWALFVLALSVVPFIYALQKPKRELFLVISIGLLVVGSIFMFPRTDKQAAVNPILALLVSGFVASFLWFAIRKSIDAASIRPVHDLNGLMGQIGEARTDIQNDGSVHVDGELWSARSDKSIPAGSLVKVIGREGFVIVVEKEG
jgi:Membrane-bound serine protease (ClpP class)